MLSIPHFSTLFFPQMFLFYQPSVNSFFMHDLPIPGSRWESGASWGSVSVSYLSDSSSSHEIRWIHCQYDNSVSSEWSIMSRSWFGNRTQFVIKFSDWTTPCRLKLSHDFCKLPPSGMFQALCNQNNQIMWAVFHQLSFHLPINDKNSWPILCLAQVG